MPNMDDMCLWCNKNYGNHFGAKCPDQKHFFTPQGSLGLQFFAIGTKIAYYTESDASILEDATNITRQSWGTATIRALANPLYISNNSMLLVWGVADNLPSGVFDAHTTVREYAKLMAPADAYGYWVSRDIPVKYVVSMATATSSPQAQVSRSGMHCSGKYCSEFNPYAEINTTDGKYLCYACRGRPACMR